MACASCTWGSGWQWWGRGEDSSRAFGKAIPCRHLSRGFNTITPREGLFLGPPRVGQWSFYGNDMKRHFFLALNDIFGQVFLCEQWAAHSGKHFRFAVCFGGRVPNIFPAGSIKWLLDSTNLTIILTLKAKPIPPVKNANHKIQLDCNKSVSQCGSHLWDFQCWRRLQYFSICTSTQSFEILWMHVSWK